MIDSMVEYCLHKQSLRRKPTAVFLYIPGITPIIASTIMLNKGMDATEVKKGGRRGVLYGLEQQLVLPRALERAAIPAALNSANSML